MTAAPQDASPKSRRYFYSDALAAAWMAKHFGMRFLDRTVDDDVPEDAANPRSDTAYEADCGWGKAKGKYYIHPDTLHLLEPKSLDLVDLGWIHPCGQSFHELTLLRTNFEAFCDKSTCDYDSHRIIQRNGNAFHWPEQEAA